MLMLKYSSFHILMIILYQCSCWPMKSSGHFPTFAITMITICQTSQTNGLWPGGNKNTGILNENRFVSYLGRYHKESFST